MDLISNTTAMPAVLWTDWMNSSGGIKRNKGENQWGKEKYVGIVLWWFCYFSGLKYHSFKIQCGGLITNKIPSSPSLEAPLTKALHSICSYEVAQYNISVCAQNPTVTNSEHRCIEIWLFMWTCGWQRNIKSDIYPILMQTSLKMWKKKMLFKQNVGR